MKPFLANLYRYVQNLTDIPGFVKNHFYENDQSITITYSELQAVAKTTKDYINSTLSTTISIQTIARCLIPSAKTRSIWQTSLSKFNNHVWQVRSGTFSGHQNYRDGNNVCCSRIWSEREFQLTDPKLLGKVTEEAQKCSSLGPYRLTKQIPKNRYRKLFECKSLANIANLK